MKKYIILTIAIMLLSSCSVLNQNSRSIDLNGRKVEEFVPRNTGAGASTSEVQEQPKQSTEEAPKSGQIASGSLNDAPKKEHQSLGLPKKETLLKNLGPAENSKAKSVSSGNQKQSEKSGSSDSGNLSAVWKEIGDLKSRQTLVEERLDSSPGVKKGVILKFTPGLTSLTSEGQASLEKLSEDLKNGSITNVAIGIHTDKSGTDTRNKTLTEERKKSVKAFFQKKGVEIGEESIDGEITSRVNQPSITIVYSEK